MLEVLFIVGVGFFLIWIIRFNQKSSMKKFPPGPTGLPLIGYVPFLGWHPFKTLGQLSKKYGDVYSIYLGSTRVVIVNKAEFIREACKQNDVIGRPKVDMSLLWSGCGTDQNHGILTNEGEDWAEQKRFAIRHLKDLGLYKTVMEDLIHHEIQEFVETLRGKVDQSINITELFHLAVVNSLWMLVAGRRFRHDDPELLHVAKCVKRVTHANAVGISFFFPKLAKMFPHLLGWEELESSIRVLQSLAKEEVASHKVQAESGITESSNLISIYLKKIKDTSDTKSSFYGQKGDRSLVVTIMDFFGAGVETTSTALSWACLYLAHFTDVQKKAQEEIDQVLGQHQTPTLADKKKMPYMEAVVYEVLRISGMVPLLIPHTVTKNIELNGFLLPKGTFLMFNAYHVMHDPENFDRPEEFNPERFIAPDGSFQGHDAFLAFGIGKRKCLGENLGKIQMFLFLSSTLQNFVLEFPPGKKPSLQFQFPGMVLHPAPYSIVLHKRGSVQQKGV